MTPKRNLTIDDIARELGVSKTTVSRAISGKGRIGAATRDRVQAYIQEHNYRPNATAKALAESRTYNVALVLPHAMITQQQSCVHQSMSAICEEAFLHDYNVLVCLSNYTNSDPLIRTLDNRKVDGIILSCITEHDHLFEILPDRGIPFATMGSLPARCRGQAVVEADHDQTGGCRAFSIALLSGASCKTALLGGDISYVINQNRLAGFREACKQLDIPIEQTPIRLGLNDMDSYRQAVDALLSSGIRRFICMDDDICIHVASILKAKGLRIPEDAQIASMYDDDQLLRYDPPITALHFDASQLGRVTCRELLNFLSGLPYDPAPRLEYEIFIRKSTR